MKSGERAPEVRKGPPRGGGPRVAASSLFEENEIALSVVHVRRHQQGLECVCVWLELKA